jgi:hypothetical protein
MATIRDVKLWVRWRSVWHIVDCHQGEHRWTLCDSWLIGSYGTRKRQPPRKCRECMRRLAKATVAG